MARIEWAKGVNGSFWDESVIWWTRHLIRCAKDHQVITPDMAQSVSQGQRHAQIQLGYCGKCGKRYFITKYTFSLIKGKCDCCWRCCDAAMPPNNPHAPHIEHRPATPQDILDTASGIIKSLLGS